MDWGVSSAVFSGVQFFASYARSSSTGNSEPEDTLEPLSFIISLAVAFLLPKDSKPIFYNHRINWDTPSSAQGLLRSFRKIMSNEKTDHLLVIKCWPKMVELALGLWLNSPWDYIIQIHRLRRIKEKYS